MVEVRTRRLAAVWFADLVGYTQLAASDEDAALAVVRAAQHIARHVVAERAGRIVKFVGDGIFAFFDSIDGALQAALMLQTSFAASAEARRHGMSMRIGVHLGEVVETDGDLYGDGVNVAARLEEVAQPGQVVVSEAVYQQIRNRSVYLTIALGERPLKGLDRSVPVFLVERHGESLAESVPAAPASSGSARDRLRRALGDRYELGELLGQGGFAEVFRATDMRLKRDVAIKVLRPDLARGRDLVRRFYREGQTIARLRHPHVVPIFTVEEVDGLAFFIMPFIQGRTLEQVIQRNEGLLYSDAIRILVESAEALQAAHDQGIVHRDVKPDNILLEGDEQRVLLSDFGIAKALELEAAPITGPNVVIGTPQYVSPEQASGSDDIDHRSDVYSLGVIAFRLLSGRLPFEGTSARSLLAQHVAVPAPDLRALAPQLPAHVTSAVMRCVQKDPQARWTSVSEFAAVLSAPAPAPASVNGQQEAVTGHYAAEQIARAIIDRSCVLFLGTRVPIGSDADPSLTQERLVYEQLASALDHDVDSHSLSHLAQQLEMERGRATLVARLRLAVQETGALPRDLFRRVARIPVPVIVTTGYDTGLEDELNAAGRSFQRLLDCHAAPSDDRGRDIVVRLFGSLDDESSLIVTEDDLWEFFSTFGGISDALKSWFARSTLVFVGYDPADETFRRLLAEVSRFRALGAAGAYLVNRSVAAVSAQWAEKRSLHLVPLDPAEFIAHVTGALDQTREDAGDAAAREIRLPGRPYKFLNYFEEDDAPIFFGRANEVRKFSSKVHAYTLNLLYAPSGTGKTSLIRAGLMPALRDDRYLPVYARVYDDPALEIRSAVLDAVGGTIPDHENHLPLERLLPSVAGRVGKPLVVILDQFEEIFVRFAPEYRARFAATLAQCIASSGGRVRFVLSLREDFLARLSEFRDEIPLIFHNEFALGALSADAAREAIVAPARLFGIEVEAALADRLIEDLTVSGIEPPQLQIVCDTLYDELEPDQQSLTLRQYLALGEARRILGRYLERVLNELPDDERRLARALLKNLVTSEETKAVTRVDDLARMVGAPADMVARVLDELSARRLVRRVTKEEGFWYELMHEYLVDEIRTWLSEKEKEIRKIRELLDQALRNHRNLGMLMPAAHVGVVRSFEADLGLGREDLELLRASEAAHGTRRRHVLVAAAAMLALLLTGSVAARYAYLNGHVFLEAEDRQLVQEHPFSGETQEFRFEGLRLWQGSPERRWLDAWLGFPKDRGQLDAALGWLEIGTRDTMKAGLMLNADTDVGAVVFDRLTAEQKVVWLLARGRIDEGVAAAIPLFANPAPAQGERLDSVTQILAFSGISDARLFPGVLRNTLRPSPPIPLMILRGPTMSSAGRMLRGAPLTERLEALEPLLGDQRTRADAAYVAIETGLTGAADGVARTLIRSGNRTDRQSGLGILNRLHSCADVRALAREPDEAFSWQSFDVGAFWNCLDPADWESLAVDAPPDFAGDVIRNLQQRLGSASVPAATALLRGYRGDWAGMSSSPISAKAFVVKQLDPTPEWQPLLSTLLEDNDPDVPVATAAKLAVLGDPRAVPVLITRAAQTGTLDAVTSALLALSWFDGGAVIELLGRFAVSEVTDERIAALNGMRWKRWQDLMPIALHALGDPNQTVRSAATRALISARPGTELDGIRAVMDTLDAPRRLYLAYALQLRGGPPLSELFRDFLEGAGQLTTDRDHVGRGVVGLRDAYLRLPVDSALSGLHSFSRDVRNASMLALAEHTDTNGVTVGLAHLAESTDPLLRERAAIARWALNGIRYAHALLDTAFTSFERGEIAAANEFRERARSIVGFQGDGPLAWVVSGASDAAAPRRLEERMDQFEARIAQFGWRSRGEGGAAGLLFDPPGFRAFLEATPEWTRIRTHYRIRVMLGLQDPVIIDHLPPLQPSRRPSQDGPTLPSGPGG